MIVPPPKMLPNPQFWSYKNGMHQKNKYQLTRMCHRRCLCVPKRRLQACNFYEVCSKTAKRLNSKRLSLTSVYLMSHCDGLTWKAWRGNSITPTWAETATRVLLWSGQQPSDLYNSSAAIVQCTMCSVSMIGVIPIIALKAITSLSNVHRMLNINTSRPFTVWVLGFTHCIV